MEWDTLLYAVLPIAASLVTLLTTQRYERRRALEDRKHDLERIALEQRHSIAVRLFDQRFETYDAVLQRAQEAVEAGTTYGLTVGSQRVLQGMMKGWLGDDQFPGSKERLDEAKGALAGAERALLVELDRAMLLATRPVRDALRAFQLAVFEAKKHEETKHEQVLDKESKESKMVPIGMLEALVARGKSVASYAQRREAVRELMSDEMRAESQPIGELPGGVARTVSPTVVLAEGPGGILEPRIRE